MLRFILGEQADSAVDSPGQILSAIVAVTGGYTAAGLALGPPGVAAAATSLAVGTGSGTPGLGDTALFAQIATAPVFGRSWVLGSDQPVIQALIPALAGAGWWTEVGVFGGSVLYAHVMLPLPFLKTAQKSAVLQHSPS